MDLYSRPEPRSSASPEASKTQATEREDDWATQADKKRKVVKNDALEPSLSHYWTDEGGIKNTSLLLAGFYLTNERALQG
jgi:hypothetical protein